MTAVDEHFSSGDGDAYGTITACIIARDEAGVLPDCLQSVSFCQEIVVIDSGSTDATVAIARAAGARVVEQPWLGFAAQRNVALDHAHGAWVLEIDADERVSPALRAEIEAFVVAPTANVDLAGLPLRELFLGRALGPSAKYPKYRHRLLRRGAHRHDESRTVHEGFVPDGPVHPFNGDLTHLLATSWSEALGDSWRYARLEAGQLQARRSASGFLKGALARPLVKLAYRLAIDGGWRDGWAGVAKIALDCATDSIVWVRYAAGWHGHERGNSGVPGDLHYGAWKARLGAGRVVAVASGGSACEQAIRWLSEAALAGADASLIADEPVAQEAIRVRRLTRRGPLSLIRALEAEEQLRPIDAVVAFGGAATLLARFLPASLRGHMSSITADTDATSIPWGSRERLAVLPL
jgi:glycosyltransferase involved in cell wall biosynthesis